MMKIPFGFCILFVLCTWGCHSELSPVGEWQLCAIRNGKPEKIFPETVMVIDLDGNFACSVRENGKTEHNAGRWRQQGTKLFFRDKTEEFQAVLTDDGTITFSDQPFQRYGIRLIYARKK